MISFFILKMYVILLEQCVLLAQRELLSLK